MGRSGERLTTLMTLRTISMPGRKQKTRNIINSIVTQYLMKSLEEFKDLTYLGYKKKQVKSEPNEEYFNQLNKFISYLRT